ncbi:MAG TPA: transaldolase [Casimicrobiaceae bacterium]|nr:transaldolase [Casimicrobiaceae bacterium]
MNPNTRTLHELGQSLWLDNITREILTNGTLARYIAELSVTGLTSNPTIFEHAIANGHVYDEAIGTLARQGKSGEDLFFALARQDLTQAADLLRPVFDATGGVDGWVSLEVSPLLADDTAKTIRAAARQHAAAARPNLFIKIPGTPAGLPAIEESIFAGVPINVTLLFSREHYLAAAEAYLRGIERRIGAGLDPRVGSVASLFVSRWDVAVQEAVSPQHRNRLGIAVAMRTYRAYRDLLASARWQGLAKSGARPQRLLWASTGTKSPKAPDTLYVEALAAPDTIDTMPEKTLHAYADHGKIAAALPADGGNAEAVLEQFRREGIDDQVLAARLQREGADAFSKSWSALLSRIREKSSELAGTVLR